MQDKEFDDLFRSRLENFQAEPSAQMWKNIGSGLGASKRRSILPILGIAASVLVLMAAGILFIPKKAAVKPVHRDSNNAAVNQLKPTIAQPESVNAVSSSENKQEQAAAAQSPVRHAGTAHQQKLIPPAVNSTVHGQPIIADTEPLKSEKQPAMAVVTARTENNTPVIVLDAAPSVVKHTTDDATISIPPPPVSASMATLAEKVTKPAVKKHGVRNFGDLVNLVVAKVDKRKDKLIQFSDADDDESIISAVHIGALRIKKDN